MINIRKAEARGKANYGWLDTNYSFSFANYYDPNFMGFSSLRVINEDKIQASKGFDTHGHQDMEIITYLIEGELAHKDSMGNGSIIYPGEVQRMSAGTGIFHSEYNSSPTDLVHLLQIWIQPETKGLTPSYEQKKFSDPEKYGKLRLIASRDGRENSVTVHQDVNLYSTLLDKNDTVAHQLADNRCVWIQMIRGSILLNDQSLSAGDGAAIVKDKNLTIKSSEPKTELLLFDLTN